MAVKIIEAVVLLIDHDDVLEAREKLLVLRLVETEVIIPEVVEMIVEVVVAGK
jgi:hypothetical protein